MKKLLMITLFIVVIGGFIKYTYITNRCKSIDSAVQYYFSAGIFNDYRMYNIGNINLSFSNGNMAVVKIDGMEKKSPHRKVAYSVFLERSNQGTWKVKKVYPAQVTINSE